MSWWLYDYQCIPSLHRAALFDDAHDASPPHEGPISCAIENRGKQTRHERFNLPTWIAKSRYSNDGGATNTNQRAGGQHKKVKTASGDVFAQLPRSELESSSAEFIEQFCM